MTNRTEAKLFEELVARIEAVALPKGATITSPDRLRNSRTGSLQEVDVAIRHRIGTVDTLLVIECRKHRSRRQDIQWVQQLVAKRADLNINKLVAVSATGFTKAAQALASQHGVELRTISEVSHAELEGWFLSTGVVHLFRKIEDMRCLVYLQCTDGGPTDEGLLVRDVFEPILYHRGIASPFPPATLFHLWEAKHEELFLVDPRKKELTPIQFAIDGDLTLDSVQDRLSCTGPPGSISRYAVHFLLFQANFKYEFAEFELAAGQHARYSLPAGEIQRTTFGAELFGLPFEFEHQRDLQGEDHVSFRVLKRGKPEA